MGKLINKFTGKEITNQKEYDDYIRMMIGICKNKLEKELNRPVSFREAMEEMNFSDSLIATLSNMYNIDDDSEYILPPYSKS